MNIASRTCLAIVALSAGFLGISAAGLQQTSSKPPAATEISRGKYLVEEVAKCQECHTPRNSQGDLDNSRWLQGASIWITPVHPTENWAQNAPAIAGFPGYSDADAVNILEKGIGANAEPIRPPMHIYHMNHADAQAIVAYLRSLPSRND
jgi:mono/diheme cytochrome c family protein